MTTTIRYAALIGCGDYLRWLIDSLNSSKHFKVTHTFDLDPAKSALRASQLKATVAKSVDEIFSNPDISIVLIFTPPWARTELFERAVAAGKHIITTKPLANNLETAHKLVDIVGSHVNCAVHYGRAGNASVETMKKIFDSGEIGKLALYKEDWFHHYPTWNAWATDREKNGGPFMDAMIHNLNKARYLMGSEAETVCYHSDNHAQKLKCNDTESMKLTFRDGGAAHLFITWAADLEVYDPTANEREHYGISHYITDQGWYVKETEKDGRPFVRAHRNGEEKFWPVEPLELTPYDQFVVALEKGQKQDADIEMACRDLEIMHQAVLNTGTTCRL